MITAQKLLKKKGAVVISIQPEASIYEAVQMMVEKNVGAILVLENEKVVGILSERDCTRKVLGQEKSPRKVKVRDVMTPAVIYARPEYTLETCLAIMTEKRVRHLPVLTADKKAAGMISLGDLGKEITQQQANAIERLESLVTGAGFDQ